MLMVAAELTSAETYVLPPDLQVSHVACSGAWCSSKAKRGLPSTGPGGGLSSGHAASRNPEMAGL